MELFYRTVGEGQPLVILHGLYGASDNWHTIAGKLSDKFKVVIPDLRNHGQSPHDDEMDFKVMSEDVTGLLDRLNIQKCILLGHSMGGKLAMQIALGHAHRVEKLVVVDVAPRSYLSAYSKHYEFHKQVIGKMKSLDIHRLQSRQEAEEKLMEAAGSIQVVQFLLKNLKSKKEGGYEWKLNMDAIHRSLHKLIDGLGDGQGKVTLQTPALFIKGALSDYIEEGDMAQIKEIFPQSRIETVEGTGHWVHAEKMDAFLEILLNFI
jgi:esterase